MVKVGRICGQIICADQRQRHPALVIVVAAIPTALILTDIETLDQPGVLLPAGTLDPIQQRIPALCEGPIARQRTSVGIILPQILLPTIPELDQETLQGLISAGVIGGRSPV